MKCAKCGLELLQGTRQCPKCGSVNEFEQTPAPRKRLTPMMYGIIALAVVGLLALAFWAMGRGKNVASAQGGVQRNDTNITTAPPGKLGPSGIVTAPPGKAAPPEKTPAGAKKPKPPQEVLDYLNYVKKVEEHRRQLKHDWGDAIGLAPASGVSSDGSVPMGAIEESMLEDALDMAENPESTKVHDRQAEALQVLDRMSSNWVSTVKYLDARPAPPECREFSGAYRGMLSKETDLIVKIGAALKGVRQGDKAAGFEAVGELQKIPAEQEITYDAADDASKKLDDLVGQYDMPKPFDILSERPGKGSIVGAPTPAK